MYDFTNKTALITGASGGIGSECAKILHKFGAHVIISGTNSEKLAELAEELGSNYTIKLCDLSNQELCASMMGEIEKLDILVCNAGITKDGLTLRMSTEDFEKVIDVNLISSFILNKHAIKKMIAQKYGRIINISSVVAFTGNPGQANYCASKAGLVGMTKSLALEVASRNVTVNNIAPGFIKTNMTDKLNEKQIETILEKVPMGKMGNALDIAQAVAFLASDNANYITGQTLHVNGGLYTS
jgi:3-oxoacyl-[acyl-carrier protein] reductase